METTIQKDGDLATISLKGSFDTNTSSGVWEVFSRAIAESNAITLDMSGVKYLSSAGIRVLRKLYMELYKKNGSLEMTNVPENILSLLNMAGLLDLLHLESR